LGGGKGENNGAHDHHKVAGNWKKPFGLRGKRKKTWGKSGKTIGDQPFRGTIGKKRTESPGLTTIDHTNGFRRGENFLSKTLLGIRRDYESEPDSETSKHLTL